MHELAAETGVKQARSAGQQINDALTGLLGHLSLAQHYAERGESTRSRYHLDRGTEVAGRITEIAQRLCTLCDAPVTPESGSAVG